MLFFLLIVDSFRLKFGIGFVVLGLVVVVFLVGVIIYFIMFE